MRTEKLCILTAATILSNLVLLQAQWESRRGNLPDWVNGQALDACGPSVAVVSIGTVSGQGGIVWRTTDAGMHWEDLHFPGPWFETVVDISMPDNTALWVATTEGRILRWQASDTIWSEQFRDITITGFMNYIRMFDSRNGIAMGDANADSLPAVFLKTSDGGAHWSSMNDSAFGPSSGDAWRRLDFLDPERGFFYESGFNPQKVFKTTDGCANWIALALPDTLSVMAIRFFDGRIGGVYAGWRRSVTVYGRVFARTLDSGGSWEVFPLPTTAWGNDIEFVPGDASRIWMTEDVKLYFSADTGRTWTERLAKGGRDIHFADPQHGWMLGDAGVLYYTANAGGITAVAGPDPDDVIFSGYELCQNYPNPFNPTTTIGFRLPEAGNVKLRVFDLLGREVATLVDANQKRGVHETSFDASGLPSGVYFYRLEADNYFVARKMLLIR